MTNDRRPKAPAVCNPTLMVTFRKETIVAAQWRHNAEGCYAKGCGGTVEELPLDHECWPSRAEIVARA